MRAWTFQDVKQKAKLGDKAPWSAGWYDPDTGKKRSKQLGSKTKAERYARKLEGQAAAGLLEATARKAWDSFYEEFKERKLAGVSVKYRAEIKSCVKHFVRLAAPKTVDKITTKTIDAYVAARRQETTDRAGRKLGPRDGKTYKGDSRRKSEPVAKNPVSPATINTELRHIRAVLQKAKDWGYMAKMPKFTMLKAPKKRPRWVTADDFARMYGACKGVKRPAEDEQEYKAADWWRALITFLYLTGWRIGETMALSWDQVSLDEARATTLAETNKSGEDEEVPLHPAVVAHLRKIVSFGNPGGLVFWWPYHDRTLRSDFADIQERAGIDLTCTKRHDHTPACHRYGFHDFRRGFATANAKRLGGDALQALMRHKSYETTKRYIDLAHQVEDVTEKYMVPKILQDDAGDGENGLAG